nr:PREDICTED: uncharacterized protein LOC107397771 [Tribolium castaneum]|eukprot:XP_015834666.1 PREDICTED: uncharacterized protein LOC107397771 [Tribolium castaneum]
MMEHPRIYPGKYPVQMTALHTVLDLRKLQSVRSVLCEEPTLRLFVSGWTTVKNEEWVGLKRSYNDCRSSQSRRKVIILKMEGCRYVINTFVDLSGLGLRYIVRCLLGFRLFHAIRTPLIKDFIVITTILHQLMASTCLISDWRY